MLPNLISYTVFLLQPARSDPIKTLRFLAAFLRKQLSASTAFERNAECMGPPPKRCTFTNMEYDSSIVFTVTGLEPRAARRLVAAQAADLCSPIIPR